MQNLPLSFKYDSLIDDLQRRTMGTLTDILRQGASRDIEQIGIILYRMNPMEVLFKKLAESDKGSVGDTRHIEFLHFHSFATSMYPDKIQAQKILHIVSVSEGTRQRILPVHLIYQQHQPVSLLARYLTIR